MRGYEKNQLIPLLQNMLERRVFCHYTFIGVEYGWNCRVKHV